MDCPLHLVVRRVVLVRVVVVEGIERAVPVPVPVPVEVEVGKMELEHCGSVHTWGVAGVGKVPAQTRGVVAAVVGAGQNQPVVEEMSPPSSGSHQHHRPQQH
jgi:hypothetical protein